MQLVLQLTQGKEESYGLQDGMRFWDARFLLLPNGHPATKHIIEHQREDGVHCDIYTHMDAPLLAKQMQ